MSGINFEAVFHIFVVIRLHPAHSCRLLGNPNFNLRLKMNKNHDLAIPTLPCRSIDDTVKFYRKLGFEGAAHEFNHDYAIFHRGSIELHFFTHRELVPELSSAGCYLRVHDVDRIYETCAVNNLPVSGIPRIDRLEDKPWGLREFAIVDIDGNLIRIGQIIPR